MLFEDDDSIVKGEEENKTECKSVDIIILMSF